ncbi:DUF3152 domain-containing protein [Streptomyces albofaciens]|uniref:DUF3152 domain-containing protein n=1 Tax=Streptomyces albofaciens TaxID=66866 RepID=UPI001FCC1336|nr:DUF3152 domain-containing protein [Streptomyces albofaciens]
MPQQRAPEREPAQGALRYGFGHPAPGHEPARTSARNPVPETAQSTPQSTRQSPPRVPHPRGGPRSTPSAPSGSATPAHGFAPFGNDVDEGATARPAPGPAAGGPTTASSGPATAADGPIPGGTSPSGPTTMGAGTGPLGAPLASRGRVPAPRQEYVDAFDRMPRGYRSGGVEDVDDDVFAAGAPERGPVRPAGRPDGFAYAADGAHGEPYEDLDLGGLDADGHRSGPGKKGAKGRTFTGVAAAAVTTVLAVVVAGQVAEQQQDDGKPQALGEGDRTADGAGASRSHTRPTQQAVPATYDQKMAQVFPLDEKLTASGRFKPAGGDAKAPGHGRVWRYRVDVEEGMDLDGQLFADAVHKTLNDERSWAHGGQRTFQRVGSGRADFVITLASPGTTAKWCAKSGLDTTEDNVSCDSAATERVMINAYRWAQGARTYGPDKMHAYRQMLINHEVGHRLGHNHESCARQGALAPVMMQQTKFLTTDGATCRPNAWPFPDGR